MSGPRPRLTYLITGLQYGGANVGMVRVLSQLSDDAFDVTVASVARTDPDVLDLLPEHVDVVRCEMGSKLELHRLRPLVSVLRKTDILVCSLFHATAVGTVLGTLARVPTILIWHHSTTQPNQFRSTGYVLANRIADRILADSAAVERVLHSEYAVDPAKISTLPLAGIDTETFSPDARTRTESETIRIATAGRLSEPKGYPELLACARRMDDGVTFHVAGTGPERETLTERAPGNVEFHGKLTQSEMPRFYANADVYFQPSRWEGLCMTVVEAMACGRPVVGSAVGGITESVIDGETGFLCPPRDVDCFVERIKRLADAPDRRETMGAAGRRRVTEQYSAAALGDGFRRAIDQARTESGRTATETAPP